MQIFFWQDKNAGDISESGELGNTHRMKCLKIRTVKMSFLINFARLPALCDDPLNPTLGVRWGPAEAPHAEYDDCVASFQSHSFSEREIQLFSVHR